MKNIKLLIVILIVAFSAFNISMSITENSENNITLHYCPKKFSQT